jgi:hypothetical protein
MGSAVIATDTAGSMTPALEVTDVSPQAVWNSVFYQQSSELQPSNTYGISTELHNVSVADYRFFITINCDFANQTITLSL